MSLQLAIAPKWHRQSRSYRDLDARKTSMALVSRMRSQSHGQRQHRSPHNRKRNTHQNLLSSQLAEDSARQLHKYTPISVCNSLSKVYFSPPPLQTELAQEQLIVENARMQRGSGMILRFSLARRVNDVMLLANTLA